MHQSNPLTIIKNKLIKIIRRLEETKDISNVDGIKKTINHIITELSQEINKLP